MSVHAFKKKEIVEAVRKGVELSSKEAIDRLSEAIIDSGMPLVEPDTDHDFHGGMYARTIYIPKGVVLTGREHYHEHFNFLLQGRVLVTVNGESYEKTAPAIIKVEANTSKAFFALEDSMWTTVHICKATEVDEAEDELMSPVPEHIAKANEKAFKLQKYTLDNAEDAERLKCLVS